MAIKTDGKFFEISLPNGKFAYGRILRNSACAFYNIYSEHRITDIYLISKAEVIFIVTVHKSAFGKNKWKKIGYLDLDRNLSVLPLEFIEDGLIPGNFEIYNPNNGEITPTTKDKCIGLERAAVWEPGHIEDRLIDYFEGRPNKWVEQLKLK
ncbi:Immunity protein 26 [bacterium A37T11]|nr:Immunity protein 26 [bacterium A37T11]